MSDRPWVDSLVGACQSARVPGPTLPVYCITVSLSRVCYRRTVVPWFGVSTGAHPYKARRARGLTRTGPGVHEGSPLRAPVGASVLRRGNDRNEMGSEVNGHETEHAKSE